MYDEAANRVIARPRRCPARNARHDTAAKWVSWALLRGQANAAG